MLCYTYLMRPLLHHEFFLELAGGVNFSGTVADLLRAELVDSDIAEASMLLPDSILCWQRSNKL